MILACNVQAPFDVYAPVVMFPARRNPGFPVSAIWHGDPIDLLMDVAEGIA